MVNRFENPQEIKFYPADRGDIVARSVHDLIEHGIIMSPNYIATVFGPEDAAVYQDWQVSKIREQYFSEPVAEATTPISMIEGQTVTLPVAKNA